MKNHFAILLLIIFCPGIIHAQNKISEGYIDYEFTHYYDTTNPDKFNSEILRLHFNNDISVYRNLARLQHDSAMRSAFQKEAADNNTFNMKLGQMPSGSIEQFFTIPKEQKTLSYRKFLKVNYLVPDPNVANWEISADTFSILGYKCQKATGKFKGRVYTVWFTTDIPYPLGPWKLKGLPGMILKAGDAKGQVLFAARNIQIGRSSYLVELPDDPVYTTQKELMAAIKAYRENPNVVQSEGPISVEQKGGNSMLKKVTKANNPVELE